MSRSRNENRDLKRWRIVLGWKEGERCSFKEGKTTIHGTVFLLSTKHRTILVEYNKRGKYSNFSWVKTKLLEEDRRR